MGAWSSGKSKLVEVAFFYLDRVVVYVAAIRALLYRRIIKYNFELIGCQGAEASDSDITGGPTELHTIRLKVILTEK